jgi:uncharacterized protein
MRQVIIITGASSGMGAEFTRQLAAETIIHHDKTEFWLFARNEQALSKLQQELTSSTVTIKVFSGDISGRDGITRFSEILSDEKRTEDPFSIQVLVNNAGFGTYGPFAQTPPERELDMIELNCTALTGICALALPYLTRGSRIINVASLASYLPLGNFAVYGATKAYVLSFTLALAAELHDQGIKVCALCPGPVSTNFANIASNGARPVVRHGLSPQKVVAHCLKKSNQGKHIALMALKWKLKAAASSFVGKYTGARFTYLFCKRPSQKTAPEPLHHHSDI